MSLDWIREQPPTWNADKDRIVGHEPPGTFNAGKLERYRAAAVLPGEWWRVEREGQVVGYGWMDVTWGDAEILLAVDPLVRTGGLGGFILSMLEAEARARGLNYLYNVVDPEHPAAERVTQWLTRRGFRRAVDGRLVRSVRQAGQA